MQATEATDRPIDVLFMGGIDDRRGAALAELAPHLWRLHADIRLVGGDRPIDAATPQTVFGADKHRLLSSAKLLLNIHRDRPTGIDIAVLRVGTRRRGDGQRMRRGHRTVAGLRTAGRRHSLRRGRDRRDGRQRSPILLQDEDRRAAIAEQARRAMFGELSLVNSLAPLLDRIEAEVLPHAEHRVDLSAMPSGGPGCDRTRLGSAAFRPFLPTLVTAKRLAMAENAALQRLDAAACELAHGSRQHIVRTETPAFAAAIARGERGGLVVQLRRRRHRRVEQHRRQRRRELRS